MADTASTDKKQPKGNKYANWLTKPLPNKVLFTIYAGVAVAAGIAAGYFLRTNGPAKPEKKYLSEKVLYAYQEKHAGDARNLAIAAVVDSGLAKYPNKSHDSRVAYPIIRCEGSASNGRVLDAKCSVVPGSEVYVREKPVAVKFAKSLEKFLLSRDDFPTMGNSGAKPATYTTQAAPAPALPPKPSATPTSQSAPATLTAEAVPASPAGYAALQTPALKTASSPLSPNLVISQPSSDDTVYFKDMEWSF